MKTFTPRISKQQLEAAYTDLQSTRRLATMFNVSKSTILYWFKYYNIIAKIPNKDIIPHIAKNDLVIKYNELKTATALSVYYKCSIKAILDRLHNYEITIKPKENKYSVNHNFFSQDTPEAFYLAGFIAADGSIEINPHWNSKRLNIYLSQKDSSHLELIKSHLKSNHPIHNLVRPDYWTGQLREFSVLRINSNQIVNDLKKFNIVKNKTKIYTMPRWLKTHKFVSHFMRGYIDGDGSFCISNKNDAMLSLCGNKKFLKSFISVLKTNITDLPKAIIYRPTGCKSHPQFGMFNYGGNKQIPRIINFIYQNHNGFCLKRKLETAIKIKLLENLTPPKLNIDKQHFIQTLIKHNGNMRATAHELKINNKTVNRYINYFRIKTWHRKLPYGKLRKMN